MTRVPGGAEWLTGLIQWHGRLLTLVDAGRLFGSQATCSRLIVVLRGLRVEAALAVDAIIATDDTDGSADLVLDAEALAAHPALQPGAATRVVPGDEAA